MFPSSLKFHFIFLYFVSVDRFHMKLRVKVSEAVCNVFLDHIRHVQFSSSTTLPLIAHSDRLRVNEGGQQVNVSATILSVCASLHVSQGTYLLINYIWIPIWIFLPWGFLSFILKLALQIWSYPGPESAESKLNIFSSLLSSSNFEYLFFSATVTSTQSTPSIIQWLNYRQELFKMNSIFTFTTFVWEHLLRWEQCFHFGVFHHTYL